MTQHVNPNDMKVGVAGAVPEADLDRLRPDDRAKDMSGCSACKSDKLLYPSDQVMVVRHWKINSKWGTWYWYCPKHFATARDWKNDHLAPEHLQ